MDRDDRELFDRSVRHAAALHTGAALDTALDELGWGEALAHDPRAAVSTLFDVQGGLNATSSALDQVVLTALGLEPGSAPAVVLPPLGRCDPPGALGDDGTLTVGGLGTASVGGAGTAVVVAERTGDEPVAAVVDTADLALRPVRGLDPRLGLVEVTGDRVPAATRSDLPPAGWSAAVAAGQRAVAHELVGAARTMLQLARDHAVDRIQFGQPIASFQAVRHRLADTLVAVEAADAALGAAWGDGTPLAAALSKALAGRGARLAARHCQQVLAGIGFTHEHPLHRYVRRALVLDRLLGDSRSLTHRLGEDLLAARRLPSILPL